LIILSMNLGCSSLQSIPPLRDRTLRIDPDHPGLYYDYVKERSWFGEEVWATDRYDLTDPLIRKRLRDLNFICRMKKELPKL
jgi:hypothetical protein